MDDLAAEPSASTLRPAPRERPPALAPGLVFPEPAALGSRDIFRMLRGVWPFVKPYKRHLLYLFLGMLPGLPIALVGLVLTRVFFDVIGNGHPLTHYEAAILRVAPNAARDLILWHACVAAFILMLIGVPFAILVFGYAVWILQRISNLFRVSLYARLQELNVRFHAQEKIGDAIFRMFQDSAALPQVINGLVIQPLHWLPAALGDLLWLALFSYPMALIALAIIPVDLFLAWIFAAPLRRAFLRARETSATVNTRVEETLAAIKAVKAFGHEPSEADLFARESWESFIAARRARTMLAIYRVLINTVRGLAYVGALYFGAHLVLIGGRAGLVRAGISLGLFQGALALFSSINRRTHDLINLWGSLQDVTVAIARVFEMLERQPEAELATGTAIAAPPARSLSLQDLGFAYEDSAPVLTDVCLEAQVGEITVLEGASGTGKSTLIGLLLRFFDPTAGAIRLDGRDIRDLELRGYRALFAVALQENPLFTATLRDNLAYGRPGATDDEIRDALELAGLAEFVRALAGGLDTMLGEKGAKLSSGQAQRISLARALLRDAPVLLLDEPTSALDAVAEARVLDGIRTWISRDAEHRMAIITTHRRSTAARADRIFRLDGGGVSAERETVESVRAREVSDG